MKIYAVKHKNDGIRCESRSGGVFTALSDVILSNKGVIYGCVLDKNLEVIHIRAETEGDRNRMRGSKYVQSKLGDTFKHIKNDLIDGRLVLFSGTSCQVAGLKSFLGKNYERLLCIDIVCYGVPSAKLLESYLQWQMKRNRKKITWVDFRNKKDFGWSDHVESLYTETGDKINSRVYTQLFCGLNGMRPSCYKCLWKSINHPGDITIGDYWGIDKAVPEFNDNKGVSLVFVNSEKGTKFFEQIEEDIIWKQTRIEKCMLQKPLVEPYEEPESRERFWKDFNNKDFEYIARKYTNYGIINKIKNKLSNLKYRIREKILICADDNNE